MNILEPLEQNGFCTLLTNNTNELLELGEKLGRLIPSRKNSNVLVDSLIVSTDRDDKSLSAKYKDKTFPFHTDGAYMIEPPRFIILRSENKYEDCPTLICQLKYNDEEITTLQRDVWLVNGGRGKFYASILDDKKTLRFDENCMRPANQTNKSNAVIQSLINKNEIKKIYWDSNLTLVIANWQVLHSRGDATNNKNRVLQRIWISN